MTEHLDRAPTTGGHPASVPLVRAPAPCGGEVTALRQSFGPASTIPHIVIDDLQALPAGTVCRGFPGDERRLERSSGTYHYQLRGWRYRRVAGAVSGHRQ
jgi:hypothetical protein